MKIVLLVALCGLAAATPITGRDSLFYVDDILEPSYYGVGILDQIRGALNRLLNQAESLIERRPDIQVDVADRIAELRAKIQSTVELSVDEAGDVLSVVKSGITSLAEDITKRLKQRPSSLSTYSATLESVKTLRDNLPLDFDADQRLGELFLSISEILLKSNRGLAALREYAHQKITSNHPVVMLLKQYVQYASDDDLKTLFAEMFKNLETFYGVYDDAGELGSLFREVRGIVDTEEGLRVVKAYALDLETSHPIVLRIKAFLVNADDDEVKEVLDALFQGLDYSSERR